MRLNRQTKSIAKRSLHLLGLALFISGCTQSERMRPHESSESALAPVALASETQPAEFIANAPVAALTWLERLQGENPSELASTAETLFNELFSERELRRVGREETPEKVRRRWAFYEAFIRLALRPAAERPQKFTDLLTRFERLALAGCRGPIIRNCRNLDTLALEPRSAQILRLLALSNLENEKGTQLLLIASDLGNRIGESRTSDAFVQLFLEELRKLSNAPISNRNNLRLFAEATASSIRGAGPNYTIPNHLAVQLFESTLSGRIAEVFGESLASVFVDRLLVRVREPDLWPIFEAMITRIEGGNLGINSIDEQLGMTATTASAAAYINQTSPRSGEALGLADSLEALSDNSPEARIARFLVARLISFESFDRVAMIARAAGIPHAEFSKAAEHYLRVQFIRTAIWTNRRMARMFAENTSGVDPKHLLTRAIRDTRSQITPVWKDFFKKSARVKLYYEREIEALERGNSTRDETGVSRDPRLKEFFIELPRNVKHVVTYPNTFMFAYFAEKYEYSETFNVPFVRGGITIDSKVITKELMEGAVPPLFEFTDYEGDNERTDAVEIFYSLHHALKMDLPGAYGIDMADWFRRITNAYLQRPRERLRVWAEEVEFFAGAASAEWRETKEVCGPALKRYAQELPLSGALSEELGQNQLPFLNQIAPKRYSIATVLGRALDGSNGQLRNIFTRYKTRPTFIARNSFRPRSNSDATLAEGLEFMRLDIEPILRRIRFIRKAYADTPHVDSAKLAEIDALIAGVEGERNLIARGMEKYIQLTQRCLLALDKAELDRRNQIIREEIAYFALVHNFMQILDRNRAGNGSLAALSAGDREEFLSLLPPAIERAESTSLLQLARAALDHYAHRRELYSQIRDYEIDYNRQAGLRLSSGGIPHYHLRNEDVSLRVALAAQRISRADPNSIDYVRVVFPATIQELFRQFYGSSRTAGSQTELQLAPNRELFLRESLEHFNEWTHWLKDDLSVSMGLFSYLRTQSAWAKFASHRGEISHETMDREIDAITQLLLAWIPQLSLVQNNARREFLQLMGLKSSFDSIRPGPEDILINFEGAQLRYAAFFDAIFSFLTAHHVGLDGQGRGAWGSFDRNLHEGGRYTNRNDSSAMTSGGVTQEDLTMRHTLEDEAKRVARSLRDETKRLKFAIPETILSEIRGSFTRGIHADMILADRLLKKIGATDRNTLPQYSFALDYEAFTHPYLLTSFIEGNFFDQMQEFDGETYGQFLPNELKDNLRWQSRAISDRRALPSLQ